MTHGQTAPGHGALAPSPTNFLFDIEDLACALRRLAAVGRLHAAEHERLLKASEADKRDALNAWRAAADLLEGVIVDAWSAYRTIADRAPSIAQALRSGTLESWTEE